MKSEFNFKIVYPNGQQVDMHDLNYWVSQFRIQPISFSRSTHEVTGRRGIIETQTNMKERKIHVTIQIEGYDPIDFDYLRDKVHALFNPFDEFYIIRDMQPGKRYKVKVDNLSEIDYAEGSLEDGEFSVDFVMYMPFAESIGTSLDLQNAKESDVNLWQWSQGIDGDRIYRYEHYTNEFVINNFGTVSIDPCETDLEIIIRATASNYLEITNNSTGEVYRLNRGLNPSDELKISSIQTFINGVSAFAQTNKKSLSLNVGDNRFTVTGGIIHSVTFKFRPLYY